MSGMSPTCYEEVTRKLVAFRPSRHIQMVWLVANFLVTSRPCWTCGIWQTTRQADKRAADRRPTNHIPISLLDGAMALL